MRGEYAEVPDRMTTKITEWHNTDTGETMNVDSPDWISVNGRLERGAEVSFLVATQPFSPSGSRLEIYGSEGRLVITGGSATNGPNQLQGARGKEPLAAVPTPDRFMLAPDGTPAGPPRNVAQAYARIAHAVAADAPYTPDFAHAVKRHKLIEALERSPAEGKALRL